MSARLITIPLTYDSEVGGYTYFSVDSVPDYPEEQTLKETYYFLEMAQDVTDSAITATSSSMQQATYSDDGTVFTVDSFKKNIIKLKLTDLAQGSGWFTQFEDPEEGVPVSFTAPTGQTPVNFIIKQIYQPSDKTVLTNTKHYKAIAKALRDITPESLVYYPSEMAPAIKNLTTINTRANSPFFSNLTQALSYYNGQLGDAIFYSDNYAVYRGSAGFTSTNTMNNATYEYITASTTGASWVNLTNTASGAVVDWDYATSLALTSPRLAMFPNATYIPSRASTYNGSATSLYELSCDNVSNISVYAYQSFGKLYSVSFPNCTLVSTGAFRYASNLTSAYFPNLVNVGVGAFSSTNLSQALWPNCAIVHAYQFCNCKNLSIVSAGGAANVFSHAFQNCNNLKSIYFGGTTINGSTAHGACSAFINCTNLQTIQAPNLTTISNVYFHFVASGQNSTSAYSTSQLRNILWDSFSISSSAGFSCFRIITNNRDLLLRPTITLGISNLSATYGSTYLAYNATTQLLSENFIQQISTSFGYWPSVASVGYWGPSYTELLWNLVPYWDSFAPYSYYSKYGAIVTLPNVTQLSSGYISYQIGSFTVGTNIYTPRRIVYFYIPSYSQTTKTTVYPQIAQLNLPNVLTIPTGAFNSATTPYNLNLTNCTYIESYAFSQASIYKITCPLLSQFAMNAFSLCHMSTIDENDFPMVTTLNTQSFGKLDVLKNLTFKNLKQISSEGINCFTSYLKLVSLPKIQEIYDYAFTTSDDYMTRIYYGLSWQSYNSITINIGSTIKYMGSAAFFGIMAETTSITIEKNDNYYTSNNNIYSFQDISNPYMYGRISSSIYQNDATKLYDGAFAGQLNITSVTLNNATEIPHTAFDYCSKLRFISAPHATIIGSWAFYSNGLLSSCYFPLVTDIGSSAFYSCTTLSKIDFPSVKKINEYAFSKCNMIEEINLPELIRLENYAYLGGNNLSILNIPQVVYIGVYGLRGTYPQSLYLYKLESIDRNAFFCFSTPAIYFNNTKMVQLNYPVHTNFRSITSIYIPQSLLADYQACTYWSNALSKFVTY